jgi:DNA-binding PadR family transcriptional regulator
MNEKNNFLGPFEELLILATLRLREGAYGASIHEAVEEAAGERIAIGAVYATLNRLERKGYMSSWQGEPTPERGGRAKRYFRVEGAGIEALNRTHAPRHKLLEGMTPNFGFE